jgi:hypothetical protein
MSHEEIVDFLKVDGFIFLVSHYKGDLYVTVVKGNKYVAFKIKDNPDISTLRKLRNKGVETLA